MQIDMHFYGTYAMARAAGFAPEQAALLAAAAQYVDDAAADAPVRLADGTTVRPEPTSAHRIFESPEENAAFQWRVWTPFHFLPGGTGPSRAERLVCRQALPGAPAAEAVLAFAAGRRAAPEGLPPQGLAPAGFAPDGLAPDGLALLGIICHAVEDTFSHYGFSGAAAPSNRLEPGSLSLDVADPAERADILARLDALRKRDAAAAGPGASMGHLAAGDLPDRPYAVWRFRYADAVEVVLRDNPATYLAALARVYDMCADFPAAERPRRPFAELTATLRELLAFEAPRPARCQAWMAAMRAGRLFDPDPGEGGAFPMYDPGSLNPNVLATLPAPREHAAWRFLTAARAYRNFVLTELAPRLGINGPNAPN